MIKNIKLHFSAYEDLPNEYQALFASWMGGDPAGGRELYETYFYWFNIPHEISHVLRSFTCTRGDQMYAEEWACNQFSAAYWRQKMVASRVERLKTMLKAVLACLPDPCPPGEDRAAYFNANYQAMGNNPAAYGHYQFSMVLAALEKPLTIPQALDSLYQHPANRSGVVEITPVPQVSPSLPAWIITDIRALLLHHGLALPEVTIQCAFEPAIERVSFETDDALWT